MQGSVAEHGGVAVPHRDRHAVQRVPGCVAAGGEWLGTVIAEQRQITCVRLAGVCDVGDGGLDDAAADAEQELGAAGESAGVAGGIVCPGVPIGGNS